MVEQAPARILVVANDAATQLSLDAILRRRGYEVATAANGEEALGWLMLRPFDLLLIDLKLPGINGLEVARCAQRCQPSTNVLFLIGGSISGALEEEQVGNFDYMLKAASPEEVLDRVAAVLEHEGALALQLDGPAQRAGGRRSITVL